MNKEIQLINSDQVSTWKKGYGHYDVVVTLNQWTKKEKSVTINVHDMQIIDDIHEWMSGGRDFIHFETSVDIQGWIQSNVKS